MIAKAPGTVTAALLVAATFVATAPGAQANWSAPRTFTTTNAQGAVPSVNGHGDVALLWTDTTRHLRVTVAKAGGPVRSHTLATGVTTATATIDDSGRVTVAWIAGRHLWAAHASTSNHWSAPQQIAGAQATSPALAVSPGGRVLLGWVNDVPSGNVSKATTGVAIASPAHGFQRAVNLQRPQPTLMPGELPPSQTGVAFDASGTGFVWDSCAGDVRTVASGSTQFALTAVGPRRALGFSLAVADHGDGLAGWIDSRCSGDPSAGANPGPARARALQDGSFATPVTLTNEATLGATQAFWLLADGGFVNWTPLIGIPGNAMPGLRGMTFSRDGTSGTAFDWPARSGPMIADGRGDLVLADPTYGYRVRRQGGGEDPFDQPHPSYWAGNLGAPAAAPHGRRFAAAWDPDLVIRPGINVNHRHRTSISVWRP